MALAVLQQCTRKNVGGIMSEDMFSFTNTGEPKNLVAEFVEEVAKTLKWVTDEARKTPLPMPRVPTTKPTKAKTVVVGFGKKESNDTIVSAERESKTYTQVFKPEQQTKRR